MRVDRGDARGADQDLVSGGCLNDTGGVVNPTSLERSALPRHLGGM